MGQVTSLEIALLDALERTDGPQGQDRDDWRAAWVASWQLSKRDEKTVPALYANLIASLRKGLVDDDDHEIEIIEDDPELSAQKTAELVAKLEAIFPREPKE